MFWIFGLEFNSSLIYFLLLQAIKRLSGQDHAVLFLVLTPGRASILQPGPTL
jgi:hypothetical protein